ISPKNCEQAFLLKTVNKLGKHSTSKHREKLVDTAIDDTAWKPAPSTCKYGTCDP
ncbi:unnamed protein product, partial [Ceratitis capitata]